MTYKLLTVLILFTTFTSQAAVVLYGKVDGNECTIKDNKAVTTVTFQKGELLLTTAKGVTSKGLDKIARIALASATDREVLRSIGFTVEVDGVLASLKDEDSPEAASLIGFIIKACF